MGYVWPYQIYYPQSKKTHEFFYYSDALEEYQKSNEECSFWKKEKELIACHTSIKGLKQCHIA